ncbi:MAG: CBS domain-containing protein [bacterium]|nr:CBS domain-containing protein [bacterium]
MPFEKSVKDVMSTNLININSEEKVAKAARLLKENKIGCLFVTFGKKTIAGIVTEPDIVRKVVAEELDQNEVSIKEVMSKPLITIDANASITEAYYVMAVKRLRHLVVTYKEKKIGIISVRDILYAKNRGE